MRRSKTLAVVSDIHYACDREKQRKGHETRIIENPLLRLAVRLYRRYVWRRDPFAHNHLLDEFLAQVDSPDLVIANGDYSCDTEFVGVSDDAAFESAERCLAKLRARFGSNFRAVIGDHEIGKLSLFGGKGGLRLRSWHRAVEQLHLEPFWQTELDGFMIMGVASPLIALPVYQSETLAGELEVWQSLRTAHLERIRRAFRTLHSDQPVILFCHDPTALPFLWREPEIRSRLNLVRRTIIGHLHSKLFFWKSRLLAGMPTIPWLGTSIRRMTAALNDARCWRRFNVRLCPALAGIELLNDGGFYSVQLKGDADGKLAFKFHRLSRRKTQQSRGHGNKFTGARTDLSANLPDRQANRAGKHSTARCTD